ncbi:MAG TPA: peptidylprolyl isomerase, partial [Bacteroidota bacterium]|nr:peptidylprolyl isomerase [Bacteroidota bacterium]
HVRLTNAEIEEGMRKAGITLHLRRIVTATQARADSIYAAFRKGRMIDDRLFARNDSGAPDVNETTLLALSRDLPAVARAVVRLRPFELSAPVRGTNGFYLFRVDNVIMKPIETETDREAARDQAIRTLRTARADSIADQYVQRLMRQHAPVIKAEGYNIVHAFLGDKGLSHDKRIGWNIPSTFMTEAGALPISDAGTMLQKPLVTIGNRQLSVGDYLRWFDIRQFQMKTSSLEAFNRSVRQTIWKMTQDKLLSGIAYARGLNARDTVRRETEKWRAKLLYLSARASLVRAVRVSDAEVKKEYQTQKRAYTNAQGAVLPFDEVKQYVRSDLQQRAMTALLVRKLNQLSQQISVSVNRDRVRLLETSIASEPNPIEILYYKPGGTFPRVAFPTIDQAWQDY